MKKYLINRFCNLRKNTIRLYVKLHVNYSYLIETHKKIIEKILLVNDSSLKSNLDIS